MTQGFTLIVMPLGEMKRRHPDQIQRNCAECGVLVGIYPSGQNMMKAHPGIKILCTNCGVIKGVSHDEIITRPSAPLDDIIKEIKESYDYEE